MKAFYCLTSTKETPVCFSHFLSRLVFSIRGVIIQVGIEKISKIDYHYKYLYNTQSDSKKNSYLPT